MIRKDSKAYSIRWDDEISAVVFRWNEPASGEQFREGATDLLEFIRAEDATKLIVDTSGIPAHQSEDKEWLSERWVPQIVEAGIEYAATVHRDSVIAGMDIENLHTRIDGHDHTVMTSTSLQEARDWIGDK